MSSEKKNMGHLMAGGILSGVLILYSVVLIVLDQVENKWLSWLSYLLMIGILVYFIKQHGKEHQYQLGFGNLFSFGFKATAFATIIMLVFQVGFNLAFPEMREKIMQIAMEKMSQDPRVTEEALEMGAAFLMSLFGLSPEVRDDHAQYLASWKKVLTTEPEALQKAAVAAQEAADFLIDKMPSMKETVATVTNAGSKATDAVRGGGRITSEAAEKAKGELTDELRSEIKSWLSGYSGDNKFLKSIKSQLKRISSGRSGGKTDLSDAQWAAILKAYREATKK